MNSSGPASLELPFGTFRITARSQRPGAAGSAAAGEGLPAGGSSGGGNGTATTSAATGMEAGLEDGAGSRGVPGGSGGHTSGPQLVMRDGMVQGDPDVTIRPDDARSSAVVLMVGQDVGRDTWRAVMGDTRGQLTGFFTTPTHFVGATVGGQVVMSKISFITGAMGSISGSDAVA